MIVVGNVRSLANAMGDVAVGGFEIEGDGMQRKPFRLGARLSNRGTCLLALVLIAGFGRPALFGQEPVSESPTAKAIQAFEDRLTGATLDGHFVVTNAKSDGTPELRAERYEIQRVRKLPRGNLWLFEARIVYGEHDITVPIPLPVEWANQTPVITLNKVAIPGLGTFDARVLIDGDRYVGTWQHDDQGGHLFGIIRKTEATPSKDD